jgi:hypothetical protein
MIVSSFAREFIQMIPQACDHSGVIHAQGFIGEEYPDSPAAGLFLEFFPQRGIGCDSPADSQRIRFLYCTG